MELKMLILKYLCGEITDNLEFKSHNENIFLFLRLKLIIKISLNSEPRSFLVPLNYIII